MKGCRKGESTCPAEKKENVIKLPHIKERKDSGRTDTKRNKKPALSGPDITIPTAVAACIGVAAFYFFTKAPTVTFVDSGEIAVSIRLGGILHPTGYPLYSLLAGTLQAVSGSLLEPVTLTNTMSGLYATLSLLFLVLAARLLGYGRAALFIFPTGLALSRTYWEQATITEVYSLSALCFSILIFLFILGEKKSADTTLLTGLVAGLAAGNHYSAFSIIPGLLLITIIRKHPQTKSLFGFFIFFLLGASVYLYLPLQEGNNPLFSWGGVDRAREFFYHISGGQYSIWMFSVSPAEFVSNISRLLLSLIRYDLHIYLPLILAGFPVLLRNDTAAAFILGAAIIFNLLQVGVYDIPDIEGYLLPTVICLFFLGATGAGHLINLPRDKRYQKAAFGTLILFAVTGGVFSFTSNRDYCNHASDRIAYEISRDILMNCEDHSILLTDNWDIYAPILYMQHAEGKRPDVTVIDKELLRRRWYFDYLTRYDTKLMTDVVEEKNHFLAQLSLFANDLPYDPLEIQASYISFLESLLVSRRNEEGEAYVLLQSDREALRNFMTLPWPLVSRLGLGNPDGEFIPDFTFVKRLSRPFTLLFNRTDYRYLSIQSDYFHSTALYFSSLGRHHDALRCADYCLFLLQYLPETDRFHITERLLIDKALITYASGNVQAAINLLKQAVNLTGSSRASTILERLSNQKTR